MGTYTVVADLTDQEVGRLLSRIGQFYAPALLPDNIERGPVGDCFDVCALQAAKHREYTYVEGVASNPEDPTKWILHAWLTDGVFAFDPTWRAIVDATGKDMPVPSIYIGVPIDILEVRAWLARTGYKGIFANRKRWPEFVESLVAKHQPTETEAA